MKNPFVIISLMLVMAPLSYVVAIILLWPIRFLLQLWADWPLRRIRKKQTR